MDRKSLSMLAFAAAVGFSGAAGAALIDRGGGLIYDDVLNITWLQDTNYALTSGYVAANLESDGGYDDIFADGQMGWDAAMAWADQLVYGGYDNWRLPTALNQDGTGPCSGFNCTSSELGYMFYTNMGATAGNSILSGSNTANLALFTNIQSYVYYWSGTEYAPNTADVAWGFYANDGIQSASRKDYEDYAWAVRPGDVVAAVPEPASIALVGLGLVGLGWVRRRRG